MPANISGDVAVEGSVVVGGSVTVGGVPTTNTYSGTATLSSGTVVVSHQAVSAAARILVQRHTAGGTTAGNVYEVTARSNGVSFAISAVVLATGLVGASDTSTVDWLLIP